MRKPPTWPCSNFKLVLFPLVFLVILLTVLYEAKVGRFLKSTTAFITSGKAAEQSNKHGNDIASLPGKGLHNEPKPPEFTRFRNTRKNFITHPYLYKVDVRGGVEFYAEGKLTSSEIEKAKDYLAYSGSLPRKLQMSRRLPNAIVIGVKKAGTRALLRILRIHPMIQTAGAEVHFFDRAFDYGLDWYRQQMPLSFPDQLTIEKSPSYFVTERVPGKVSQMSNKTKLLVIVRDPTERAISDYTQSVAKGGSHSSFETMAINNSDDSVNTGWGSVKIGLYYIYLKRWLKYFPLDQIHFVSGEQLVKNPAQEIKAVERFLNLKPYITEDHFYFNKTKGFPCFVKPVKQECLGESKGREHVPVNTAVKKKLQDFYRPYNVKLYQWLKRNFGWP